MTIATSVSVSANIPVELGEMLDKVARAEERSKSYYIKKGLEQLLKNRLENLQDYQEAKQEYGEFFASGEKSTPFEKVFSNVK
jgi:predicted transcriptional regulator